MTVTEKTGTAPDPAALTERSRGVMLVQRQELLRLRGKALKNPEIETIHDLRVASRRLRAAVGLFEPWLPTKGTAWLKKSLRKLTRVLGALRNIDEALLFFRAHIPAGSAGGHHLRRILSKMRSEELARVERVLGSFDHRRFNRIMQKAAARLEEGLTAGTADFPLPAYFAATGSRLYQPILELLPAATSREQRVARHALRIAIKKWRYFLETAAPVLESDVSSTAALLKEYQTILGRMNDVVVFGVLCDGLHLSRRERRCAAATLHAEEEELLQKLTELIRLKPLPDAPPF